MVIRSHHPTLCGKVVSKATKHQVVALYFTLYLLGQDAMEVR